MNAVNEVVERSSVKLTDDDLRQLAEIARADREQMFDRSQHWAPYRDRLLAVALCQGAALHYLDGKNGVKDLDVWMFFAARSDLYPDRALYRRNKAYDYGPSRLGRHPDLPGYAGRKVDVLSDSIPVGPDADPVEAIRHWLRTERRKKPAYLAQKAVVLIEPDLGRVVWPE